MFCAECYQVYKLTLACYSLFEQYFFLQIAKTYRLHLRDMGGLKSRGCRKLKRGGKLLKTSENMATVQ